MLEKNTPIKKQDSIMQLIKLLFYALMVGVVLSMSKQKIISRLIFWPLFIFAACMFTIIPYFLFFLITFFQIDERNCFMHFGKVYTDNSYAHLNLIEYEFSLNVLFIILSIFLSAKSASAV